MGPSELSRSCRGMAEGSYGGMWLTNLCTGHWQQQLWAALSLCSLPRCCGFNSGATPYASLPGPPSNGTYRAPCRAMPLSNPWQRVEEQSLNAARSCRRLCLMHRPRGHMPPQLWGTTPLQEAPGSDGPTTQPGWGPSHCGWALPGLGWVMG